MMPSVGMEGDADDNAIDGPGINRTTWEVTFATNSAPGGRRFCRKEEAPPFSRGSDTPGICGEAGAHMVKL